MDRQPQHPNAVTPGQTVDLTAQAAKLSFEPKFRTMVIRAAVRLLKTRGVVATIPEPEPLVGEEPPPV